MIKDIDEAIAHAKEVAEENRKMCVPGCDECAAEHEQLAEMLTELKQLRERVKSLEHSAEYYRDSFFGDGIAFSLKIMRGE